MFKKIYIDIPRDTVFYPAIGPYRSLTPSPEYIIQREATRNYDEAIKYCRDYRIIEEAIGVFMVTEDGNYTQVCRDNIGYYKLIWEEENI